MHVHRSQVVLPPRYQATTRIFIGLTADVFRRFFEDTSYFLSYDAWFILTK